MDKKDMWYIHTAEYYSAIKNELMPFAAMELQIIILSEAAQKRQISCDIIYMWSLKR